MKKFLLGIGIFLGLLVLIIILLPFLVDLNQYRDQYIPVVEEALNRKVNVENVRLTIIPHLGVQLDGVKIHDDPEFGSHPFLTVPTVQVAVKWAPLLSKKVHVERVQVEKPSIQIIRSQEGILNTASIGKGGKGLPQPKDVPPPSTPEGSMVPVLSMFAVERLWLTGGTLQFEDRSTKVSPDYRVAQLQVKTDSVQLGKTAKLRVSGLLEPTNLPFDLEGQFGPIKENLDLPTIDVVAHVDQMQVLAQGKMISKNLDLTLRIPSVATDEIPLDLGLTGPISIKEFQAHLLMSLMAKAGASSSEPRIDSMNLNLQLGQESIIQLSGKGTPSRFHLSGKAPQVKSQDLPVALPVQRPFSVTRLEFEAEAVNKKIHFHAFRGQAFEGNVEGQGIWDGTTSEPTFSASGHYQSFGVQPLLHVLQAASDISVAGTGNVEWNLSGLVSPAEGLRLRGPVQLTIQNGELIGVNVLRQIDQALGMPGLLSDAAQSTLFSLFDAHGAFEPKGLFFKHVNLDSKAFVVRSKGLVGFDQTLGMRGDLILSQKVTKKILKRIPLAKVAQRKEQLVVPFVTVGTVQNPKIQLDTTFLGDALKKKVERSLKKALEGDQSEIKNLIEEGKGLLDNLFRK